MGENSILNSDETFEKIATMPDEKQTNYMLQRMINDYLTTLKMPSTEEILSQANVKEEPGVLTKTHVKLLQCMVKDYYTATGKNIEDEAREKGVELVEGELSTLEQETVDKLLVDYCTNVKEILDKIAEE